MVAATVHVQEGNGGSPGTPTITDNVADLDMGSVATTGLDPVANPITAGSNGYEKWFRIEMHAKNDASQIQNYKVWVSAGSVPANCTFVTNMRTSGWVNSTYALPIATTSTLAAQAMPVSEPATTNVGKGGTLGAACTADLQYTDWCIMQLQTTASATAGTTFTLTFKYEEVA